MSSATIFQCQRADYDTEHAAVLAFPDRLEVMYGRLVDGRFSTVTKEILRFDQHPELKFIHDGIGWNVLEVSLLLMQCCDENA